MPPARTQPTGRAGRGGAGAARVAFWYGFGASHPRVVLAADEEAARVRILDRHPEARGQRLWIEPFRA